jgi:hypothetical protein
MVQKMCTHVCKCKNDSCCNYSMDGRRVDKGGGELKCDIFDTL